MTGARPPAQNEAEGSRAQPAARVDQHPNSDPARRVGKVARGPPRLANLGYTDQEDEIRRAIHAPGPERGVAAPQEVFPTQCLLTYFQPAGTEPQISQSQDLMGGLSNGPELKFLRRHTPHLSLYVSSYGMHELRKGATDARGSVRQAHLTASGQSVSTHRVEAAAMLGDGRRAGTSPATFPNEQRVHVPARMLGNCSTITTMPLPPRPGLGHL